MTERNIAFKILSDLKKTQNIIRDHMHRQFQELNLTAPQGMLLYLVKQKQPIKISEISKEMGLSNSTVSGIVDRLEKINLVKRQRSEVDRRVVHVLLGDEVEEKLSSFDTVIGSLLEQATQNVIEKELEAIATGLNKLVTLLEASEKGDVDV